MAEFRDELEIAAVAAEAGLGDVHNPISGAVDMDLYYRALNLGFLEEIEEDQEAEEVEGILIQKQETPWKRIIKKVLLKITLYLMAYGFLIGLVYMNLWDPCALVRIPSARTCSFQFVLHETFLSYTEVKEEFYCLIPGTRFTIERKGWNLGIKC